MADIIIGIDPGTRVTGYGVLRKEGRKLKLLDYGTIRPEPTLILHLRYRILHESVHELLDTFQPTAMSIETQFVYKNAASALKLGMARGVLLLAATQKEIPIYEYTPSSAKSSVAGKGNASKPQVQRMIQYLLELSHPPTPEDAADALALAICHAHAMETIDV